MHRRWVDGLPESGGPCITVVAGAAATDALIPRRAQRPSEWCSIFPLQSLTANTRMDREDQSDNGKLSIVNRRENFVPAGWPKELAKRAMWDTDEGLSRLPTIRVALLKSCLAGHAEVPS